MNDCPIEIWSRIFSFACTDDGRTGRSLSTVNRYVHSASKDVKLQTVQLCGLKQIRSFVKTLERTPSNAKKVRHLYVCTHPPQPANDFPPERMFEFLYGYGRHCDRMPEQSREENHDDAAAASLLRLLQLVAPTLLTLNLAALNRDSILLPISLPHLTELSLHGPFPSWSVDDPTVNPFPRLRTLSLSGFHDYPITLFACISRLAPYLKELCLAPEKPSRMVHVDLQIALAQADQEDTHDSESRLPDALQKVTIIPGAPPGEEKYWLVPVYEDMLGGIEEVSRKDKRVAIADIGISPFDEQRMIWLECAA